MKQYKEDFLKFRENLDMYYFQILKGHVDTVTFEIVTPNLRDAWEPLAETSVVGLDSDWAAHPS